MVANSEISNKSKTDARYLKNDWKFFAIFIVLALCLSFPVQQGYLDAYFQLLAGQSIFAQSGYLLAGLSTLFAAFIALAFDKNISIKITVLGDTKFKNALIALVPLLAHLIAEHKFEIFGLLRKKEN